MIDALAIALTVMSLGCVVVVAGRAFRKTFRRARCTAAIAVLQTGLAIQAVLDVIGLARGHRPGDTATHLAYLAVSLVVLPLAAQQTRGDDGGWSAVLLAGAFVVVAVVVVRMETTWRSG